MKINAKRWLPAPVLFVLITGILLGSCDKSYLDLEELPDYTYNPTIAIPVIKSSLTLEDIFKEEDQENIRYGHDNLVTLHFREPLLSYRASDFFSIPDQHNQTEVMLSMQQKSIQHEFTHHITLDVGEDVKLDSVMLRQGTFRFSSSATQLQAAGFGSDIEVTFPQTRDAQGAPVNFRVSAGEVFEMDLNGVTLLLSPDKNIHNQLVMNYKVVITGSGNPQQTSYPLQLESNFMGLQFEKVYGYLGNHVQSFGSHIIPLDVLSLPGDGNIELASPTVTFRATNSIGVPISLSVNPLVAVKDGAGENITGLPDPMVLNTPSAGQPLESVNTEVVLTADNSNVAQVMAGLPQEIQYGLSLEVNPLETGTNFAFDSGELNVEMEVELPLEGRLSGISLKDTFDIDLQQDVEDIQWVELNLAVANGFPLDAHVQVQFLDASNAVLMNLFEDQQQEHVVVSGQVDSQGKVTAPGLSNTRIMLDESRVQQFFSASRIVVVSQLNTANQGDTMVKILSDYSLEVNLGARVSVHSNVSF